MNINTEEAYELLKLDGVQNYSQKEIIIVLPIGENGGTLAEDLKVFKRVDAVSIQIDLPNGDYFKVTHSLNCIEARYTTGYDFSLDVLPDDCAQYHITVERFDLFLSDVEALENIKRKNPQAKIVLNSVIIQQYHDRLDEIIQSSAY